VLFRSLDIGARQVAATVATDVEPTHGQLNRTGDRLYVIHAGSAFLNAFSVPQMVILNRILVGFGASALRADPRTGLLYVGSTADGRIQAFDSFSLQPVDWFDVADGVSWMAIDETSGALFALMPALAKVAVIDLTSRKTLSTLEAGPAPFEVVLATDRR
jgi:hypothetical protein